MATFALAVGLIAIADFFIVDFFVPGDVPKEEDRLTVALHKARRDAATGSPGSKLARDLEALTVDGVVQVCNEETIRGIQNAQQRVTRVQQEIPEFCGSFRLVPIQDRPVICSQPVWSNLLQMDRALVAGLQACTGNWVSSGVPESRKVIPFRW